MLISPEIKPLLELIRTFPEVNNSLSPEIRLTEPVCNSEPPDMNSRSPARCFEVPVEILIFPE